MQVLPNGFPCAENARPGANRMRNLALFAALGLAIAVSSLPLAAASNPPGPVCSGLVSTNCWYCSNSGSTAADDPTHCYENWYGHAWAHCSLMVSGVCYLS